MSKKLFLYWSETKKWLKAIKNRRSSLNLIPMTAFLLTVISSLALKDKFKNPDNLFYWTLVNQTIGNNLQRLVMQPLIFLSLCTASASLTGSTKICKSTKSNEKDQRVTLSIFQKVIILTFGYVIVMGVISILCAH